MRASWQAIERASVGSRAPGGEIASTFTLPRIPGAGRRLVERLGLSVVREDGRDLRIACVACRSEDNGHVDADTGVYGCWSCSKGLSAWDLAKVVLGDVEAAKLVMIEIGLFEGRGPANRNTPTVAAVNGKPKSDEAAFLEVCRLKNVPPDAWRKYDAVPYRGGVKVPMFGPRVSDVGLESCSSIHITPENGKGIYEKGKPTGLFLPGE